MDPIKLFRDIATAIQESQHIEYTSFEQLEPIMTAANVLNQTALSPTTTTATEPPATFTDCIHWALLQQQVQANTLATVEGCALALQTQLTQPAKPATPNMGIKAWLASDDTSAATRWLLAATHPDQKELDTYREPICFPNSAKDIERCIKLMAAVPTTQLTKVDLQKCGTTWQYILENWLELIEIQDPTEQTNHLQNIITFTRQQKTISQ